jgi:shikimate kinase
LPWAILLNGFAVKTSNRERSIGSYDPNMQPYQHLYLTGYRGTGKSSIGAMLAKQLGRSAIDLDQVIEGNAGETIREIFDRGREPLFRQLESEALATVAQSPAAIVALGGGAILSEANRAVIRRSGVCFWLDAEAETIADRIKNDDSTLQRRPALTSLGQLDEVRLLLSRRRGDYENAADHRIDTTGQSLDQVAGEILRLLEDDAETPG